MNFSFVNWFLFIYFFFVCLVLMKIYCELVLETCGINFFELSRMFRPEIFRIAPSLRKNIKMPACRKRQHAFSTLSIFLFLLVICLNINIFIRNNKKLKYTTGFHIWMKKIRDIRFFLSIVPILNGLVTGYTFQNILPFSSLSFPFPWYDIILSFLMCYMIHPFLSFMWYHITCSLCVQSSSYQPWISVIYIYIHLHIFLSSFFFWLCCFISWLVIPLGSAYKLF